MGGAGPLVCKLKPAELALLVLNLSGSRTEVRIDSQVDHFRSPLVGEWIPYYYS